MGSSRSRVVARNAREVRPRLRRWAARRAVREEPARWSALVKRARELDARSGAAIVRGNLDGIDSAGDPSSGRVSGTPSVLIR
jgi:hypothetical protein